MLPLLDIADYLADPDSESGLAFVRQLRNTCHGAGFFYLVGHGIDKQLDEDALEIANRFFDLPLEKREALAIGNSLHFRGYTLLENEMTGGVADWRDQIDIGPEESAPTLSPGDPPWLRLRGPNQWPSELPTMSATIGNWMSGVQLLGMVLMQALAQGLGQGKTFFDDRMSPDAYTRVKIIRYPAHPDVTAAYYADVKLADLE